MLIFLTIALVVIPPIVLSYLCGSLLWALLFVPVWYVIRGLVLHPLMTKYSSLFIPIQIAIDVCANLAVSFALILYGVAFGVPALIWTIMILYFWLTHERK